MCSLLSRAWTEEATAESRRDCDDLAWKVGSTEAEKGCKINQTWGLLGCGQCWREESRITLWFALSASVVRPRARAST